MPHFGEEGSPLMACATCKRVLDYDGRVKRLVHGAALPEDHPVIAVTVESLGDEIIVRCDVCGEDHAQREIWTLPVRSFPMPDLGDDQPRMSVGDWATCEICKALIVFDRWDVLMERVLDTHGMRGGPGELLGRLWIAELHAGIQANRLGPPRRVPLASADLR